MPNPSHQTVSAYDYWLELLSQTTDKQQLADIIEALMTKKEQQELQNRLKIFALLEQGVTQREISAQLGVGIATVSRGAKAYQQYPIEKLLPDIGTKISL